MMEDNTIQFVHVNERIRNAPKAGGGFTTAITIAVSLSQRWIAQHLAMESVSNVTFCLQMGGNR
jgi:hypothetical protein